MIVQLDSQDFVIGVQREPVIRDIPSDAMIDSVMREVERADMPVLQTQICKGPWHNKSGRGTPLPLSAFPPNRYHPEQRTKTCAECLEKSGKRNPIGESDMPTQPAVVIRKLDTTENITNHFEPSAGAVHKWRVTVIKPTEEIVYAATYLDIAQEVDGEIVKVERID